MVKEAQRGASMLLFTIITIASLVLAGWLCNINFLKTMGGLISMNPLTAVLFIVSSIANLTSNSHKKNDSGNIGKALAGLVVFFSAIKIIDFFTGSSLALDELIFKEKLVKEPLMANTMAPNTAFCFFFLGISILAMDVKGRGTYIPFSFSRSLYLQ